MLSDARAGGCFHFEVINSKAKVLRITSGKVDFPEVIVVASTAKSREFFVVSRNKRPRWRLQDSDAPLESLPQGYVNETAGGIVDKARIPG